MSTAAVNGSSSNGGYDANEIDQGSLVLIEKECQAETVLMEAQRDLDNAEFRMGFIFNPLRHLVLEPALGLATHILPPVAKAIPFVDVVAAAGLSIPFGLSRSLYMKLHSEQADAQWKTYHDAVREFEALTVVKEVDKRDILVKKPGDHTVKGFLISATFEFVSDPTSNLQQWLQYTDRLSAYIRAAGIDDEISRTFSSERLLMNARILGNIQAIDDNVRKRRIKAAIPGAVFEICPKVVAK